MKYFKVFLFFVAVSISVPSNPVFAQVSRKDQAKAHFQRGNVFYEEGKYLKAIKELKEAYRLIPKPVILLYIANIYKEADLKEEAIQYYRRFLNEARLKDPQRPKVVEILKGLGASPKAPATPVVQPTTPVTNTAPVKTDQTPVKKNKPKKKYKKGELIHTPLEEAQPGHPAKLEVELPDEIKRAWLYVYYRKPGQDKYTKVKMKVDKNDVYYFILPCSVMNGNILQYYIEAVGVSGRRIAGSATDSSPFIVDINKSNPLQPGGKMPCSAVGGSTEEGGNANIGTGGSSSTVQGNTKPKSFYFAIGSSVATGIFVVASVSMGIMAMNNARLLEDAQMIPGSVQADYDKRYQNGYIAFAGSIKDYETAGKMYERTMFIASGLAVVSAAAATYFWLDYLKKIPSDYSFDAKFGGGAAAPAKTTPQTVVIPLFGKDSAGLGISFRF